MVTIQVWGLIIQIVGTIVAVFISVETRFYVRRNDKEADRQKWRERKDMELSAIRADIIEIQRGFTKDNNERWMRFELWRPAIDDKLLLFGGYIAMSLNILTDMLEALRKMDADVADRMTQAREKIDAYREGNQLV